MFQASTGFEVGIISALFWAFIPSRFDAPARYIGITHRESNETAIIWSSDSEEHASSLEKGFLYKKGSKDYKIDMSEYKKREGLINTESFIFWQTGVAHGYNPMGLASYKAPRSFFDHIELFFTIGPVMLVECLMKGVYYNLIIFLLLDIIVFWKHGLHFFENEEKE